MTAIGVDIGGTSVKVAVVDVETGNISRSPRRAPTPRPALPEALTEVVAELVGDVTVASVGVGFPGVMRRGVAATAANLGPSWLGLDVASLLGTRLAHGQVVVINDADAAGLAEMRFGSGQDMQGVVVMVTLGTGIGTAVFSDGVLVPNTEYGHILIDGVDAETLASGRAEHSLGWDHWSDHLEAFLRTVERLTWPDAFIIGGGISAEFQRFCTALDTLTPVVAATLGNDAGIVGAALAGAGER